MQITSPKKQPNVQSYTECKLLPEKVKFLSQFAELSPSRLNTRPWKIVATNDQIQIYADFTKRLNITDPYNRELFISLGCVLANLEIAAEHFGLAFSSSLFIGEPPNNLFSAITFDPNRTASRIYPVDLFYSMLSRHVNRDLYSEQQISKQDINSLYDSICWIDGVYLYLTNNPTEKAYLAKITEESEKEQFGNISFRREFLNWIGRKFDSEGLELSDLHLSPLSSLIFSLYKNYNIGGDKSQHDKQLIANAPYIAIVLSHADERIDWISTGVAFQILALRATTLGIRFHPLTSGMEVPYYRDKIKDIIEATKTPQMMVRLGYDNKTPPSTTT